MKHLFLAAAMASCTLFASCLKSAPETTPQVNRGELTGEWQTPVKGLLLTTMVFNQDNTFAGYLVNTPDLKSQHYNNQHAVPVPGETGMGEYRDRLYVFPSMMGNGDNLIKCYQKTDSELKLLASIPTKANSGALSMCVIDDTKAYVSNYNVGTVSILDLKANKIVGEIDLNAYAVKGALVRPAIAKLRDGMVYMALNQLDAQWQPVAHGVQVALLDPKTDKVVKMIRDDKHGLCTPTRPIDPQSMFFDEQGNLYVSCLGSWGFNPMFKGGLLRIKKGETEFDPNFGISYFDAKMAGIPENLHGGYAGAVTYLGGGKVMLYLSFPGLETDPALAKNPYAARENQLCLLDLNTGKFEKVADLVPAGGHSIALHYDGQNLVFVGHSDLEKRGVYVYHKGMKKFLSTEKPYISTDGFVVSISLKK